MHASASVSDGQNLAAPIDHQLQFLWLEITQHCNLRCRHCYTVSSPARKHNDIDWLAVATDAYRLGCRQIQFIGGEPLTHPRILDYLKGVKSLGYPFIEVFTNAALLSDEICDTLEECEAHVATSFYSSDPEVHDEVTVTKGSFADTIRGIERVTGRGIPLRVGVIMAEDDDETPEQKMAYLETLGVDRDMIRVDYVRPVGRGAKLTPYESREKTLCGACWNGKLAVSYDGNCYPCVFSRDVTVGNIKERPLLEIAGGPALYAFRDSYRNELQAAERMSASAANYVPDRMPSLTCPPVCTPTCQPAPPCAPDPCTPNNCAPDCTPSAPCAPICPPSPCVPANCVPVNPNCQPSACIPEPCPPGKGG